MDIQEQIAFEKFHAKECNCDYNELKRRLDHQEKVMGHRYIPSSPRHEAWLVWDAAWQAKVQAVPEGFVLVPKDQYESLNEFKGLYKRAIINARKRKDQLNWAHVAGLGVGSGRAVELCKMLNIDPSATNMHEVIEAQEQNHG